MPSKCTPGNKQRQTTTQSCVVPVCRSPNIIPRNANVKDKLDYETGKRSCVPPAVCCLRSIFTDISRPEKSYLWRLSFTILGLSRVLSWAKWQLWKAFTPRTHNMSVYPCFCIIFRFVFPDMLRPEHTYLEGLSYTIVGALQESHSTNRNTLTITWILVS